MSTEARQVVVVTGISGNLGRTLTKLLHRTERIVGLDRRPFAGAPKDVELFQLDLRKKKAEDVFRIHDVKAVIHMGIMHDPRMSSEEHHSFNVVGTTRVLDAVAKYGVKKVVVLSSANVYGPSPDNSNFLSEDAPLMAASRFSGVRDLIEVDMLAHGFFWRHPDIETVILRPVHIVGPSIRNAPSNYLRLRYPWVLAGFDPMLQLVHQEDAARAMVEALRPGLKASTTSSVRARCRCRRCSGSWAGRRSRSRIPSRGRCWGRCSGTGWRTSRRRSWTTSSSSAWSTGAGGRRTWDGCPATR